VSVRRIHRRWARLAAVTFGLALPALVWPSPQHALALGHPAPSPGLAAMCGNVAPASGAPLRHLIVLVDENASSRQVIGSPDAPYQTQLAAGCGAAANMYGVTHPSLPNYLAVHSGRFVPGTFRDCRPKPAIGWCVSDDDNIFHQLSVSGQTWRSYSESESVSCQLTPEGSFAPRHAPARYFTDLLVAALDGSTDCSRNDVPMGDLDTQTGLFYDDLRDGVLPAYSFISPNLVNDGHDSDVATADAYLARLVPLITAAPNYQAGDTALVITYDEGSGPDRQVDEDCTDQSSDLAGLQPSCAIPLIVVSPYTVPGTQHQSFCTLYCLTKTIEDSFGLPLLGHAGDPGTQDLAAAFNLSPSPEPPVLAVARHLQ
jgi:phospholipase C